jgi:hypothetical protein
MEPKIKNNIIDNSIPNKKKLHGFEFYQSIGKPKYICKLFINKHIYHCYLYLFLKKFII